MRRRDLLISGGESTVETKPGAAGGREHDLDEVLLDALLEDDDVPFDRADQNLDVLGEHPGGELDIADRHANRTNLLPIILSTDHFVHHSNDTFRNGVRLDGGHEALGTEDTAQVGLLKGGFRIDMADEPVEGQLAMVGADYFEQGVLAIGHGAGVPRLVHGAAPFLADDGDARVVLHGVGQPDAVAQHGSVLDGADLERKFVCRLRGRTADFCGAEIPA